MKKLTMYLALAFLLTTPFFTSASSEVDEQVRRMREIQAQMGYLQAQMAGVLRLKKGEALTPPLTSPLSLPVSTLNVNRNLSFGLVGDNDVLSLQQFLTRGGYYSGPVTGNYLNLTREAVIKYHRANDIKPTGFFGPLSRAR